MLEQAWHAHHGTLCRGVSWDRQPLSELQVGGWLAVCWVHELRGSPLQPAGDYQPCCLLLFWRRRLHTASAGWGWRPCAACWRRTTPAGQVRAGSLCCWLRQGLVACLWAEECHHGQCEHRLHSVFAAGGMPDLLLWHPGRRAAMLSEVKGPRDQLSDQQLAWLHVLADGGLEVEVLKVVEPGAGGKPKGKKRRRL